MRKPDCETVNRVRVARIPARDRVICVNFSALSQKRNVLNMNADSLLMIFHKKHLLNEPQNPSLVGP